MATKKKAVRKTTKRATAKKTTVKRAKKTTARKPVAKKKKATSARKGTAFMKPMKVSPELQAIVGKSSMPRTEVTKKIWDYIKKHKLQDAKNKRNINPDAKLGAVIGKGSISMFKMTAKVSKHLS